MLGMLWSTNGAGAGADKAASSASFTVWMISLSSGVISSGKRSPDSTSASLLGTTGTGSAGFSIGIS